MSKQIIDFNDVDNMVFDNDEVVILKLNDSIIWEKPANWLNYTAIDANGYDEYSLQYNGTPVEYAIGKPDYTYLKQVSPTPTTQEEYIGKRYYAADATIVGYYEITTDNIEQLITNGVIVVGETIVYDLTKNKSEAIDESSHTYPYCSGYNNEYYNYNFQTPMTTSSSDYVSPDERVIDETLIIPDTYKGKPVTAILANAFCGSYTNPLATPAAYERYQSCFLKTIILGNNITKVGNRAFYNVGFYPNNEGIEARVLENIYLGDVQSVGSETFANVNGGGYDFDLPTSLIDINNGAFAGANKIRINSNIVNIGGSSAFGSDGIYIWNTPTIVIFSKNVTSVPISLLEKNQVLVFEQDADVEVTISVIDEQKSALAITIYTDNNSIRNYNWSKYNYTPTFYSLSEFQG